MDELWLQTCEGSGSRNDRQDEHGCCILEDVERVRAVLRRMSALLAIFADQVVGVLVEAGRRADGARRGGTLLEEIASEDIVARSFADLADLFVGLADRGRYRRRARGGAPHWVFRKVGFGRLLLASSELLLEPFDLALKLIFAVDLQDEISIRATRGSD